ncbi:MAG: cyclodeaminase/cyclohydrolase family protein [Planctomycetota bacterium]|nr:cyclodeaminase/cyclohydrolase family protein [Planctomycetota bacterium]
MTQPTALVNHTLSAFTDQLAARSPTPGGGSMAAYLVASGSALGAMACRFTSGEKFAAVEGAMARRVETLESVRTRALKLVDLDSRSYDAVTAAYKLPKASDAEKAARSAAIQAAMKGALEIPAETMERALEALRIVAAALTDVNPNLVSDGATGATCLWSAAESALLNVRINAASIQDKEWASARLAHCLALSEEAHRLLATAKTAAARHLAN